MNKQIVPEHIAIIMDGNGRWAKKRFLPRNMGHRAGANTLLKIVKHAAELGVKYITAYAFSTENWKRSDDEVSGLMKLFSEYLVKERENFIKNGVKLLISGRRERVPQELLDVIDETVNMTKGCENITLNIAFNYGGRAEIVDAINRAMQAGEVEMSEDKFAEYLYNQIPDPELLIRTSGEMRISNFLLWQIAYSEIYVTDVLWPDFNEEDLEKAIEVYQNRDRRFGGVKNEK
jgi:undecaprenyl diphosphate synthase